MRPVPALAGLLLLALAASPGAGEPSGGAAEAPPQGIHAFVAAYPDFLAGVEKGMLVWKDGTKMPLSKLGLDREGRPTRKFTTAEDPAVAATEGISAVDYEPIYLKMYGDCRKGPMGKRLVPVAWGRDGPGDGEEVLAARANGVAAALQRISDEIEALGGKAAAFHRTLGGTFNCRTISESTRLSLHGFGIAIDVSPSDDGYWQTAPTDRNGRPIRADHMPPAVVEVFERHGFVWGGRWNQFDTFHFEYRPEYRIAAGGALPERLTRKSFTAFFGGHAKSAAVERMSYGPRKPGAVVCHRWVRQPGPRFGTCLDTKKPAPPARRRAR